MQGDRAPEARTTLTRARVYSCSTRPHRHWTQNGGSGRKTPPRPILGLLARIYDESLSEGPHVLKDPRHGLPRGRGAAAKRGGTGGCSAGAQVFHQAPATAPL